VPAITDVRDISRIGYGFDADGASLTPAWLSAAAGRAGFSQCEITPVVPGTTRMLTARR
jgi:hypothetical protein